MEENSKLLLDERDENQIDQNDRFDALLECKRLLHVALPSVVIQFSLYFVFPLSASSVGRLLGTEELAGFSLGSLVGNLTCLSVIVGALSAADTLMPRAYGERNFVEMGHLAIRGIAVCSLLLAPPIICLAQSYLMQWILIHLGQDPVAARLASEWIRLYLLGLPANMVFRVLQRFFVAQHQPWPPAYATLLPSFVLQPLLLKILVPRMGLAGSAVAVSLTQWSTLFCLLFLVWIRPVHHPHSRPEFSLAYFRRALAPRPFWKFLNLSLGGVASLSEWWFWETMCFVAGSFGVIELCAHTIAYNLIPLLYMIPLGLSIGLTVRMGTVIAFNPRKAQLMAVWTMGLTVVLASLVVLLLYKCQSSIVRLFTTDPAVIQQSGVIWPSVCHYIFVLYIFGINTGILRALGLQWRMATIVLVILWCVTLPLVLYFSVVQNGGLVSQWEVLPAAYTLMQVLLILSYTCLNWGERSNLVRESMNKSAMQALRDGIVNEDTVLLTV